MLRRRRVGLLLLVSSSRARRAARRSWRGRSRIVGGEEAKRGDYPWMAALLTEFDGSESSAFAKHECGGTLVDPEWVLTATHCVQGPGILRLSVLLGAHSLESWYDENITSTTGDLIRPEWRPVSQVVIHPIVRTNDTGGFFFPDAALLQLATPSSLPPVALASRAPDVDENTVILGWGSVNARPKSAEYPERLHETVVPVVDDALCHEVYLSVNGGVGIYSPFEMCAGLPDGGTDACFGDSGGPMLVQNDDGDWEQVGITSYGITPCASDGKYGVYTDIEEVLPFLDSVLPTKGPSVGDLVLPGPTYVPTPSTTSSPSSSSSPSTMPCCLQCSSREPTSSPLVEASDQPSLGVASPPSPQGSSQPSYMPTLFSQRPTPSPTFVAEMTRSPSSIVFPLPTPVNDSLSTVPTPFGFTLPYDDDLDDEETSPTGPRNESTS